MTISPSLRPAWAWSTVRVTLFVGSSPRISTWPERSWLSLSCALGEPARMPWPRRPQRGAGPASLLLEDGQQPLGRLQVPGVLTRHRYVLLQMGDRVRHPVLAHCDRAKMEVRLRVGGGHGLQLPERIRGLRRAAGVETGDAERVRKLRVLREGRGGLEQAGHPPPAA